MSSALSLSLSIFLLRLFAGDVVAMQLLCRCVKWRWVCTQLKTARTHTHRTQTSLEWRRSDEATFVAQSKRRYKPYSGQIVHVFDRTMASNAKKARCDELTWIICHTHTHSLTHERAQKTANIKFLTQYFISRSLYITVVRSSVPFSIIISHWHVDHFAAATSVATVAVVRCWPVHDYKNWCDKFNGKPTHTQTPSPERSGHEKIKQNFHLRRIEFGVCPQRTCRKDTAERKHQ